MVGIFFPKSVLKVFVSLLISNQVQLSKEGYYGLYLLVEGRSLYYRYIKYI